MALLAAACGDTADTTTTTVPPSTDPPPTEVPATEAATPTVPPSTDPPATEVPATEAATPQGSTCAGPVDTTSGGASETEGCYYLRRYLVSPEDVEIVDERVSLLDAAGIDTALQELTADDPPEALFGERIDEYLNVYEIPENAEELTHVPLQLANELGGSPLYVMGPAPHWSFLPGEDPDVAALSLPQDGSYFADAEPMPDLEDPAKRVAVVDTGYIAAGDDAFGWLDSGVVALDPDPDGNGHGTFVASIIRQISPESLVVVARAHTVNPDEIVLPDDHTSPPMTPVTSSLHVVNAIEALKNHAGPDGYAVWNLSLGTYLCPGAEEAIRDVMEALETVSGTKVAAAGNENIATDFWPAAWSGATGVDAANLDDDTVLWDSNRNRVLGSDAASALPNGHQYPGDLGPAPGIDLIGTKGGGEVVSWSGSSFATAVASALIASGKGFDATSPPGYDDVPYLRYGCVDQAGNKLSMYNDPSAGPVPLP